MNRARAILLAASGFVLGSVSTLLVLSWLGELGQKYAYEPDPRLERARTSSAARIPAELPRAAGGPQGGAWPRPSPRQSDGAEPPETRVLEARELVFPVPGVDPRTILDTFDDGRNGRRHEAIDIIAPRDTPIVAVDDGLVRKLFTSKPGGLTVYQFDRAETFCYYYAHLERYAEGLTEGAFLRRGDKVGYVGTSGNAPPNAPHLHFAIFKLGAEKRWWQGTPINPFPILMEVLRRSAEAALSAPIIN